MIPLPPQVNLVLDALQDAGYEAYVVGGAVRDALRGCPGSDWDIATSARPDQMQTVFSAFSMIETGLKHGTVTVLVDHMPLEITTYRIDGAYTDHRRPEQVQFTRCLEEDLARRDFTINALAYHPKTGVVDCFGGQEDLAAGLIRCVGDPDTRFQEDGLRILRALRFASVFSMEIEPRTAAAIHRNRALLAHISVERIQSELTKLLCGSGVVSVLREFADVAAECIPECAPMFGFNQHNPHHDRDVWEHTLQVVASIPGQPVLRWAALLHDIGKPASFQIAPDGIGHFYGHAEKSTQLAGEILSRLRFEHTARDQILTLIRHHDTPVTPDRKPLKRLMSRLGVDTTRQLIEVQKADTFGLSSQYLDRLDTYAAAEQAIEAILSEESCFSLKDLCINGNDLIALGFRGKEIGRALSRCLNAVMEETIPNEREALLAWIRSSS